MGTIKGWKEGRGFGSLRQRESTTVLDGFPSEVAVSVMDNSVIIWSSRVKGFVETKTLKTQKEALAYAMNWMRRHPRG